MLKNDKERERAEERLFLKQVQLKEKREAEREKRKKESYEKELTKTR